MNNEMRVLDLFAGAGGWDVAVRELGWHTDRVEIWAPARATAALNGMPTMHDDVTTYATFIGAHDVHIASPPCQTYSMAGNGEGRANLDRVLRAINEHHDLSDLDPRTGLVLEPLRLALEGQPDYIAWEQVPSVLPVWNACARVLREHGYFTGTGILNAEQYGVPQTRRRAVLMARRSAPIVAPRITHSRFHTRTPARLDEGVKPWVSMAEALGWNSPREAVSNYGTGGDPRNRGIRTSDQPFSAVTSKADRVVLRNGNRDNACERDLDQPAGTLFFGARANWSEWRPGGKLTAREAATLQTFPQDFEFAGNKGEVFQQIGNAVPPLLAAVILEALTS